MLGILTKSLMAKLAEEGVAKPAIPAAKPQAKTEAKEEKKPEEKKDEAPSHEKEAEAFMSSFTRALGAK